MIMCMIGKLGEDKKSNWPCHLAEIVHTYNATRFAVTRYGPHYLMFGQWLRLPVDFILPTIGSNEAPMREASTKSVDMYVASVRDRLRSALWEAQAQSTMEACQPKQYDDRKIGTVNFKPGNLVLVKADAWKGKRKIKDRWEEETDFFSLHQRLAFPCVWAAIIHGIGVPAPPHARLPLLEVMKRGCHKRKMARWSPNDLP